jgi:hypothetical protein
MSVTSLICFFVILLFGFDSSGHIKPGKKSQVL